MIVSELMQPDVKIVGPDMRVEDALLTLADFHVSAVPVVDPSGKIVGVLSRTDIAAAEEELEGSVERDRFLSETLVRDLMTPTPLTISPESEVREAAGTMLSAGVHRLYVTVDERVVGVIAMSDIVRAVVSGLL
jgi:chloride channel protein, CIC family